MSTRGTGALILGDPPRPETPLFGGGFPPLMLMSIPVFPPPLVPVPPLLPGPPPAAPAAPAAPFGEPPGTPGCLPSGEMEIRAARFPCGICAIGAGGAGAAESTMNVAEFPFEALDCAAPTSGAGPASPSCARG